jgi:predicted nucleic acid-binding protein
LILLDTNVLSEALRPAPSQAVVEWLNRRFPECAISSITIFELGAGLALLPAGKRREILDAAIARTIRRFGVRVYAFDAPAAQAAARLLENVRARGLGLHQVPEKLADLQIAGIALAYGLELATRNVTDFEGTGLALVNPWEANSPD